MEKEFKDYVNSLTANTTYVVSENCTISTSVTIPENVTLIFKGGIIGGTGTLTGQTTAILAPVAQIFALTLNLAGSWNVDRAYPQWFGAKVNVRTDSTPAINAAIRLKGVGEVFLTKGFYYLSDRIQVKNGIVLAGETGAWTNKNQPTQTCAVLRPLNDSFMSYTSYKYMVTVNVNENDRTFNPATATWQQAYPTQLTGVKNIFFMGDSATQPIRGILFAGSVFIDFCKFEGCQQAVSSCHSVFSDSKTITRCNFVDPSVYNYTTETGLYAFDLTGLGDSLAFRDNHINYDKGQANGLRLSYCRGGDISNNIINANIEILNSKAIRFSSNHCEVQRINNRVISIQMTIQRSVIELSGNLFEKGSLPTLKINEGANEYYDLSTVTLINNAFIYYGKDETTTHKISPYDIQTDGKVSLKILNSFRYWEERSNVTKVYPSGLAICDMNGNPVDSFNNYSYLLSTDGIVKPITGVQRNHSVNAQTFTVSGALNGGSVWNAETGDYRYEYQIIWDKGRNIQSPYSSSSGILKTFTFTKGGNGLMIGFGSGTPVGFQALLRLIRTRVSNGSKMHVDVPLCGNIYVFDYGDTVNGYRWQAYAALPSNPTYLDGTSIQFQGENVQIKGTAQPGSGTWRKGDIVYNIGSGSNAMWIYSGSNWLSK